MCKIKADTSEKVVKMYSDDLGAFFVIGHSKIQELAVFWKAPYLTQNTNKWAYENCNSNMILWIDTG